MPDFYGTEAGFETYLEERGYIQPDGDVEPALVRASTWLDATYGMQYSGYKTDGRSQLRAWPRTNATDSENISIETDDIPIEVEHATYEAARQELTTPGSLQPIVNPSKTIKKVSIEGAVSVEYANTDNYDQVPLLTIIEGLLAPLLGKTVNYASGLFGVNYRV